MRDTALADGAGTPGYAGAEILRDEDNDHVEFRVVTYWDSWAAIRRFAGDDVNAAVLYPGDDEYELVPSRRVAHHQVAVRIQTTEQEPAVLTAITGGYVVPVNGEPITGGTVLIKDGKIAAVGSPSELAVPADASVVDANGCWVLPGFVDAHTHLGIDEEAGGWAGNDLNEKTDPNTARVRAVDGINPADLGFADALSGGVTTAVVLPGSGNPIGGQAVAVRCWGRTVDDMVLREPVGVKSALGENPKRVYGDQNKWPSTRLGIAALIRDAFRQADDYRARREPARQERQPFDHDSTLDVLVRVLDGELPWLQHVHRSDDIATAIRLADEFGYRLVINHGTEAHLLADMLADRGIPVICGPLFGTRTKLELSRRTLRGPGILARAGVQFALTTDHNEVPVNFLVHQATLAVKEGLDRDTALRSITINPARILGLADRIGALEPGLDGDVVLWSGDPLDVMNRALRVFVSGRQVYRYDPERSVGRTVNPIRGG